MSGTKTDISAIDAMIGCYEYTLDGRDCLLCPPLLRSTDSEEALTFYLLYNAKQGETDRCILMMNREQFEEYYRRVSTIPKSSSAYVIARQVLSSVAKIVVGSQYKFVLPKHLQKYAGISKDDPKVTITLSSDCAEIWSSKRYEEQLSVALGNADAVTVYDRVVYNAESKATLSELSYDTERMKAEIENIQTRRMLEKIKKELD